MGPIRLCTWGLCLPGRPQSPLQAHRLPLVPQIHQVCPCLRAFAPALPSAWKTLLPGLCSCLLFLVQDSSQIQPLKRPALTALAEHPVHLLCSSLPHDLSLALLFLFSHSVVSGSLQPQGLQHTRLPCPSLSPGVCSNSCPLSW